MCLVSPGCGLGVNMAVRHAAAILCQYVQPIIISLTLLLSMSCAVCYNFRWLPGSQPGYEARWVMAADVRRWRQLQLAEGHRAAAGAAACRGAYALCWRQSTTQAPGT